MLPTLLTYAAYIINLRLAFVLNDIGSDGRKNPSPLQVLSVLFGNYEEFTYLCTQNKETYTIEPK